MDLYAEIAKMFDIPSDKNYLNRRRELIEAVGERAYLIVHKQVVEELVVQGRWS